MEKVKNQNRLGGCAQWEPKQAALLGKKQANLDMKKGSLVVFLLAEPSR